MAFIRGVPEYVINLIPTEFRTFIRGAGELGRFWKQVKLLWPEFGCSGLSFGLLVRGMSV